MTGALERIERAVAALRAESVGGPLPRWLLLSRFGVDFLGELGPRKPPIEIVLDGGRGRLLAQRIVLGSLPLLAVESEGGGGDPAFSEALPVLLAGQLVMRGVVLLLAASGLPGFPRAPALAPIRDWIRASDEDPLRSFAAERLGARFPELRGLARGAELAVAADLLVRRGELPPAIAVTRRGPSGATDAEIESWRRMGGELLVDGCAAEVVAARHQGLACVALALVLDRADATKAADPGLLAASAAELLPRLAHLLPELLRRLDEAAAAGPMERSS